jgi:predicted DNA-binding ribbon-helix-helix protein
MRNLAVLQHLLKQEHRAAANTGPGLINRNITVEGRRSSMRLEASMWDALREICRRERITLPELCTSVARAKRPALTLTAALRVLIANYFRVAATEEGHARAGHGGGVFTGSMPHPVDLRGHRARTSPP